MPRKTCGKGVSSLLPTNKYSIAPKNSMNVATKRNLPKSCKKNPIPSLY